MRRLLKKGHSYLTVVSDLEQGTVEYIALDRKKESLKSYYDSLTQLQKDSIKAISMDMWDPFIRATHDSIENAQSKIVFDKFHIMANMSKALDQVRKDESRALFKDGDRALIGSKYMWLYANENVPDKHKAHFKDLKQSDLKTARAWAIKENLRALWDYKSLTWAKAFYKSWYFWATHSQLEPIKKMAKMLKRYNYGVLNYFSHRITNAMSEGINSRIQAIKVKAKGYRNVENFKTAIYFHLGGLDLYPVTHSKAC